MTELFKMKLYQMANMLLNMEKSMPSLVGIFVLSHAKRIMNKFVLEIDGLLSNKVYYQDTDSI